MLEVGWGWGARRDLWSALEICHVLSERVCVRQEFRIALHLFERAKYIVAFPNAGIFHRSHQHHGWTIFSLTCREKTTRSWSEGPWNVTWLNSRTGMKQRDKLGSGCSGPGTGNTSRFLQLHQKLSLRCDFLLLTPVVGLFVPLFCRSPLVSCRTVFSPQIRRCNFTTSRCLRDEAQTTKFMTTTLTSGRRSPEETASSRFCTVTLPD